MNANDQSGARVERATVASLESGARGVRWTLALIALAYLPVLVAYGLNLWHRGHYQFFPLAILGAAMLARRCLAGRSEPLEPGRKALGIAALVAACLLFGAATLAWSPWLGYLSALVMLLGWAALFGGGLPRQMLPAFVMLAVLITPPLNLDGAAAMRLRDVAIQCSSRLLDALAVPHLLQGAVIELRGHRLLVEEACSGIVSVFFISAFVLFCGLWRRRPAWHIGVLGLAGVVFVVLGNVLRITLGAWLSQAHGINVLTGWAHEVFGATLLLAYVGLVLSADAAIMGLRRADTRAGEPAEEANELIASARIRNAGRQMLQNATASRASGWLWACAVLCVMGGATQGYFLARDRSPASAPDGLSAVAMGKEAKFELPERIGPWQRVSEEAQDATVRLQLNAIHSKTWAYHNGPRVCLVAVSYPYPEYHSLSVCYVNNGWELGPPAYPAAAGGKNSITEYDMTQKPAVTGLLIYGGFDDRGEWQAPGLADKLFSRLGHNQSRRLAGTHYMVQLLTLNYHALSNEEKDSARDLFQAARETIRQQALNQRSTPTGGRR